MGEARRPVHRRGDPVGFGIWIDRFSFPFLGVHELPSWVGAPLTVLWVVAVMNMVNFLDGLDGLAAGVCGIAGVHLRRDRALARQAERRRSSPRSSLGACLGFLRHNFFPARIFMGDSGALLLGFIARGDLGRGAAEDRLTVALFFPLLVLAVPILDTSFVLAKRIKHGQKLYAADQSHLHFRFLGAASRSAGRR